MCNTRKTRVQAETSIVIRDNMEMYHTIVVPKFPPINQATRTAQTAKK